VRAIRQELASPGFAKMALTETKLSYNAGLGCSMGSFFLEANAVYFKVEDANLLSIPVTVGFQF